MNLRFLFLPVFFLFGQIAFCQNTLDSLYAALQDQQAHDTTRVRTLLRICFKEYTSYPERSKQHAEEAVKLSREINYVQGEGEAVRYIGLYYWSTGDYDQATTHAHKALQIFESISYLKGLGLAYQLLGTIHKEQGDFDKAEAYHGQALEMFTKANDKRNIGYAYNALGVLNLNFFKYDEALKYFQKSMEIRIEINDKDGLSQSYVNMATVYTSQKEYTKALEYFEKNLPIVQALDNKYRLVVNYEGMGELYTLTGEYDKAESHLLKAVTLAKSIHHKKALKIAYDKLAFLERERGRADKALQYFEVAAHYKDSLYTEEKARQIAEIETRYETEKKDQQILLLEQDKRIQLIWRNIFVISLVLVTALSIVVYLLQRYRERKNREILNLQIDSLITQQNELSEKYKNVLTIRDEKSIASHDQRLLKRAIDAVEKNIANPSFNVEKMGEELGMSRTSLHRKVKEITGFPPSELIRNIRLRKAAAMLRSESDSVSQIGFAVGFEDHSYFSKAFKKQFGVSPSEYHRSGEHTEYSSDAPTPDSAS
jgi:AraC-like DNA-binding protein/tetratricopeptide (TPR) repeat protein